MPRALLLCVLLAASAFAESAVELRLPPSEQWKELDDPDDRVFLYKGSEATQLRVKQDITLRATYTQQYLMDLSRKLAKEAKAQGRELRFTDASTFEVRGVTCGRLRTTGSSRSLILFLPAEGGDLVLTLTQSAETWNRDVETEVTNAVALAKGLRGKDDRGASLELFAGIGVALVAVFVVLVLIAGRKAKKPA